MNGKPTRGSGRRILWQNVLTVVSAAILIGAEVFGAAFAGGWAVASYLDLGIYGEHIMQGALLHLRRRRDDRVPAQRAARRALHHARLTAPDGRATRLAPRSRCDCAGHFRKNFL